MQNELFRSVSPALGCLHFVYLKKNGQELLKVQSFITVVNESIMLQETHSGFTEALMLYLGEAKE